MPKVQTQASAIPWPTATPRSVEASMGRYLLDFVEGLPKSESKDVILVVLDMLEFVGSISNILYIGYC